MELVGVRPAARALGVNPSTISRQIKAGIIPNRGTEEKPAINIEEARAARAAYLDPSKRGNHAGQLLGDPAPDDDDPDTPELDPENDLGESHSPQQFAKDPTYRQAMTARAVHQAELTKIQLEEKRRELVGRADVHRENTSAGRMFSDSLQRLGGKIAGELAAISDPVEIEKVLNREHRQLLEQLARDLQKIADDAAGD